jgi:hypothetical protein
MLIWVIFLILLTPTFQTGDPLRRYTALNFPGDSKSFVSFVPDTSPFRDVLSFCGWFKRLGSQAGWPIILSYGGEEIRVQDDGGHNCIFGSCINLANRFTVQGDEWVHYCATWSSRSREFREYLNGVVVASRATVPGRTLQTGLQFTLGNWGEDGIEGLQFEGVMFNVNVYAREFSRSEVQKMVSDRCDLNEEFDEGVDRLSWENILDRPRNGTVAEVDTGCLVTDVVRRRMKEARNRFEQNSKQLRAVGVEKLGHIMNELISRNERLLDSAADDETRNATDLVDITQSLNRESRELVRVAALLQETVRVIEEGNTVQGEAQRASESVSFW